MLLMKRAANTVKHRRRSLPNIFQDARDYESSSASDYIPDEFSSDSSDISMQTSSKNKTPTPKPPQKPVAKSKMTDSMKLDRILIAFGELRKNVEKLQKQMPLVEKQTDKQAEKRAEK